MKKVLLLSMIALVSCKKQENIQDTTNNQVYETYDAVQVDEDDDDSTKTTEVRIWSADETKLPQGIVYAMDCANCQSEDEKKITSDNYVTVKRPNNILTVVKDVDEDLYLNLRIGDLIQ